MNPLEDYFNAIKSHTDINHKLNLGAILQLLQERQALKQTFEKQLYNDPGIQALHKQLDTLKTQQSSIIAGRHKVKLQELKEIEAKGIAKQTTTKQIPDFWQKVVLNSHLPLSNQDKQIFKFLKEADLVIKENSQQLILRFNKNPYFDHQSLLKKVEDNAQGEGYSQNQINIKWNKQDPTLQKKQIKQKNKKGEVRTIQRLAKKDSFFNIFQKEDSEDHQEFVKLVFDIFAKRVMPYCLQLYLGLQVAETSSEEQLSEEDQDQEEQDEEQQQQKPKARRR